MRKAAITILTFLCAGALLLAFEEGSEWQESKYLEKFSSNENLKKMAADIAKKAPTAMKHKHVMMPMRDGTKLATEIFVPEGKGPFPVVLIRTPYGRYLGRYYRPGKTINAAFVTQNSRGKYESEGVYIDPDGSCTTDKELSDSYDCVEWLAEQPWCNGRIAMIGGSGNGLSAYQAKIAAPPHLVYAAPGSSAGDFLHYWAFHNGVKRGMYSWGAKDEAPYPKIVDYNHEKYLIELKVLAEGNTIPFTTSTGWYDIFIEGALDMFEAYGPQGNVFLTVMPRGHGGKVKCKGKEYPGSIYSLPSFMRQNTLDSETKEDILAGRKDSVGMSKMIYYVLGDVDDENAPGNEYRITTKWPVENTPTDIYLAPDSKLLFEMPTAIDAYESFVYDPKNPVPTVGGNVFPGSESDRDYNNGKAGPFDQRVLNDRDDILRFETEPLDEPLVITGKIKAKIYFSTDVSDTTIAVKLIDVYPDGYQAIVRDSIGMARYHDGYDNPQPVESSEVYSLEIDLWSIAYAFNKGHKIAVHISGSNAPKYEPHPNSFEGVEKIEHGQRAETKIQCSMMYPSKIILPKVYR